MTTKFKGTPEPWTLKEITLGSNPKLPIINDASRLVCSVPVDGSVEDIERAINDARAISMLPQMVWVLVDLMKFAGRIADMGIGEVKASDNIKTYAGILNDNARIILEKAGVDPGAREEFIQVKGAGGGDDA